MGEEEVFLLLGKGGEVVGHFVFLLLLLVVWQGFLGGGGEDVGDCGGRLVQVGGGG